MVTKAFLSVQSLLNRVRSNDSGATAIEYGLIAALIAVAMIVAVTLVGEDLSAIFNTISESFPDAPAT